MLPLHNGVLFVCGLVLLLAPGVRAGGAEISHRDPADDGWQVAETVHFRIYHHESRAFAERIARAAERTRESAQRKWFGDEAVAWDDSCRLYLHADLEEFCRDTGMPADVPGYSRIRSEGGRVLSRRIDVRSDDPNLLRGVLPHEVTHVVLAGRVGDAPVPPWANEGIAVLSESPANVATHLRRLRRFREEGRLFHAGELLRLRDYPDPGVLGLFYAQSVSLTAFLANARDPQTLCRFLAEASRRGYEPALRRHYGWDLDDLERRWEKYAFGKESAGED